jgi:hypothetical protein
VTWDVEIVPQVRDWLQDLRRDDPAALAAVSAALDLLGRDGPGLGPPLARTFASMTAIHAGVELLRDCDPGFQFSANNVERLMAMSYLRELRPSSSSVRQPRLLFAFDQDRAAVVLVASAEESDWTGWYSDSVPLAHTRYIRYLRERTEGGNG